MFLFHNFIQDQNLHAMGNKMLLFLKKLFDYHSKLFLFIVWGGLFFVGRIIGYLKVKILLSYAFMDFLKYFDFILLLAVILLTIWYLYKNKSRLLERERVIARYTWIAMLIVNNLILMIVKARYQEIDFEVTHLMQMTLIGLALVIVGTVMKENYIRLGGVVYWLAVFFAMDLQLFQQFLYEAIAVAVGIILPVKLIVFREIQKK